MADYYIGTVAYVDFTPINKKPGFGENVDNVVKSAFIHFSEPILRCDGVYYFDCRVCDACKAFWSVIQRGDSYKLQISPKEYWICVKNKNPVQRTLMNIHQVVENGRYLESLVMQQAEDIKNLKETIDGLSKKLEGVHRVVHQLVGGLFCHRTQNGIIYIHLNQLGYGYEEATTENDTHPSKYYPTTRQGDENTERIEKLEEKLKNLEDDLSTYGVL
jgi:tetrahydromethanopterin S-methyltransferase subunit G